MICHCGHDSSLHTELVDLGGGKKFIGCCSVCGCIIPHFKAQNVLDCHNCWLESEAGKKLTEYNKKWAQDAAERYAFMKEAMRKVAHDYNVKFPNDGKGAYKYYIFNTVGWE